MFVWSSTHRRAVEALATVNAKMRWLDAENDSLRREIDELNDTLVVACSAKSSKDILDVLPFEAEPYQESFAFDVVAA